MINGKNIDRRTELLLSRLWGTDGYCQIIKSRYDSNNVKVTKWNLVFLPPHESKIRQIQRETYRFDHSFDFEISEFIKNKILEQTNKIQLTPIFFKLGKTVLGS